MSPISVRPPTTWKKCLRVCVVTVGAAVSLASLSGITLSAGPVGQGADTFRFRTFYPCIGSSSDCDLRLLVEGALPAHAGQALEDYLRLKFDRPPRGMQVCFNSPGGSLDGGMSLGRVIRRYGLDTCMEREDSSERHVSSGGMLNVEEVIEAAHPVCASACVLAFMGGVNRTIGEFAEIGVHQFTAAYGALGDYSSAQITQTLIALYLDEMGISRTLLDTASLVPPSSIQWLTLREAREQLLDNMSPVATAWSLDTNADGLVFATSGVVKPGPRSRVLVSMFKRGDQPLVVVNFFPADSNQADALETIRSDNPVTLSVDGDVIAEIPSSKWTTGTSESALVEIPVDVAGLQKLSAGTRLRVAVSVPDCCGRYDPTIDLPLRGLARFLPAVIHRGPQTGPIDVPVVREIATSTSAPHSATPMIDRLRNAFDPVPRPFQAGIMIGGAILALVFTVAIAPWRARGRSTAVGRRFRTLTLRSFHQAPASSQALHRLPALRVNAALEGLIGRGLVRWVDHLLTSDPKVA